MTVSDQWVTITRTESNRTDPYITITIRYESVDTRAEMSLADFALAVTGMGRVPAEVTMRQIGSAGGLPT